MLVLCVESGASKISALEPKNKLSASGQLPLSFILRWTHILKS